MYKGWVSGRGGLVPGSGLYHPIGLFGASMSKGPNRFSNPLALGSTLTALGSLQLQVFWLLNHLDPLVLAFKYYLL